LLITNSLVYEGNVVIHDMLYIRQWNTNHNSNTPTKNEGKNELNGHRLPRKTLRKGPLLMA